MTLAFSPHFIPLIWLSQENPFLSTRKGSVWFTPSYWRSHRRFFRGLRAEAGLGGAGPSEDAGGNGEDDNDDDLTEVDTGKASSSKLGQAFRTKRADARRKQAAKATLETCRLTIRSQLGLGSAGGGSAGGGWARGTEVGEMSGKERAQAAPDFDHSRAASNPAEVLAKHQQVDAIMRQAEDPDETFIAQLERKVEKNTSAMREGT